MELADVARLGNRVLDEVEKAVVGKREALELLLLGAARRRPRADRGLSRPGEDADGALVRATLSLDFSRIQFTPDLMPSDVTGSSIYNQREADFEFRPGPIFANLLLADEINRAPPKTQAALLEAMQERQVTIRGQDAPARPAVPRARDAEPDRVRGDVPAAGGAARPFPAAPVGRLPQPRGRVAGALEPGRARARTRSSSSPCSTSATLLDLQRTVEQVHVSQAVGLYMVDIVARRRGRPSRSRSAPLRAGRSRCSSCRAAARRSRAATSSRRTT